MYTVTLWDIIRDKILHYFDCPSNPDPRRVKMFWDYSLVLILCVCLPIALLIMVLLQGDRFKLLLVGVFLIGIAIILNRIYKPSSKTKERVLRWWNGEGRWYGIFF
jgi:hypothetical protein